MNAVLVYGARNVMVNPGKSSLSGSITLAPRGRRRHDLFNGRNREQCRVWPQKRTGLLFSSRALSHTYLASSVSRELFPVPSAQDLDKSLLPRFSRAASKGLSWRHSLTTSRGGGIGEGGGPGAPPWLASVIYQEELVSAAA